MFIYQVAVTTVDALCLVFDSVVHVVLAAEACSDGASGYETQVCHYECRQTEEKARSRKSHVIGSISQQSLGLSTVSVISLLLD